MINTLYGNYRTRKFTDIWEDYQSFSTDWVDSPYYSATLVTSTNLQILYYLLYGKYGNSHIAFSDENQFKFRLFSLIWQYAPTWQKELSIQDTLRSLTEADLLEGKKEINDHAYNPSTVPEGPNVVDGEITTINRQTKTKIKNSKLEAYAQLVALLKRDVTEDFLLKFKKLFLVIVEPQLPLWYVSDEEGGEE